MLFFFPAFFFPMIPSDDPIQILLMPNKTHCCKSHSHDDGFPSNFHLFTSGRQQVYTLCYVSRTTMHVDYGQANKLGFIFILVLRSKAP